MDELIELLEIDFVSYIIVTFTILTGIATINTILGKIIPDYKGPVAWMKKNRENQKMIIQNAQDIQKLSKKHEDDVRQTILYERNLEDKLTEFMKDMKDRVDQLSEQVTQYAENRVKDREQSREIQRDLVNSQNKNSREINALSEKIDDVQKNIAEKFAESEKKNNLRDQAELKDKIGSSYRYYHEKGEINDIELEALEDLITAYEEAGGKNSFVHSVVQKEMYTWKQVER